MTYYTHRSQKPLTTRHGVKLTYIIINFIKIYYSFLKYKIESCNNFYYFCFNKKTNKHGFLLLYNVYQYMSRIYLETNSPRQTPIGGCCFCFIHSSIFRHFSFWNALCGDTLLLLTNMIFGMPKNNIISHLSFYNITNQHLSYFYCKIQS